MKSNILNLIKMKNIDKIQPLTQAEIQELRANIKYVYPNFYYAEREARIFTTKNKR